MKDIFNELKITYTLLEQEPSQGCELYVRFFSHEERRCALLTSKTEFFSLTDLRTLDSCPWVFEKSLEIFERVEFSCSSYVQSQKFLYFSCGFQFFEVNLKELKSALVTERVKSFKSHMFSWPKIREDNVTSLFTRRVIDRIKENIEIPPLPPTTNEIIALKNEPEVPLDKLVNFIEKDPLLTAQVLGWARSAFYGYRGDVSSVREAIVRVLGTDIVMNLCLCLCLKKAFDLPEEGPLGWKKLWERSVATAELSRLIAKESNMPLDENYLYLGGLLSDIGYFFMSSHFRPHFKTLCEEIEISPFVDPCLLEFHLFEFSHQHLGTWLLSKWNFPTEVLACVQWHHHSHVPIPHSLYPQTVLMARYILTPYGLSDEYKPYSEIASLFDKFGPVEKWKEFTENWLEKPSQGSLHS